VRRAAAVVAWCAACFQDAPPVLNLIDPAIPTRRGLLERFQAHGWRGRMVWLPISFFSVLFTAVRLGLGLAKLRLPAHTAVWSIFRPRRYDTALSARALRAAEHAAEPAARSLETQFQP